MSTFETKPYSGTKIIAKDTYVGGYGKFMTLDIQDLDCYKSTMSNIPLDQAHALADWIKDNIPTPPKPTFKEQFDALAVGGWFTHTGNGSGKHVKLNATQYAYASNANGRAEVYNVFILGDNTNITITRIEANQ